MTLTAAPPKCSCPRPRPHVDPRKSGWCANCLKEFDPDWLSSNKTMAEFFDHLALCFPGEPPEEFALLRRECEERELAGRDQFGLEYLVRENLPEGRQEIADLVLYAYLDSLKAIREKGEENDMDLVMTIAFHAFKCYEANLKLERRRKGSP